MIGLAELTQADELAWRNLMDVVFDASVLGNSDDGGVSADTEPEPKPDKGATFHITPVQESLDE